MAHEQAERLLTGVRGCPDAQVPLARADGARGHRAKVCCAPARWVPVRGSCDVAVNNFVKTCFIDVTDRLPR